jgi:hypothetical protein
MRVSPKSSGFDTTPKPLGAQGFCSGFIGSLLANRKVEKQTDWWGLRIL